MELKDLAGLSKPLTKLVDVVSAGIGAVTKPYLIRKTADARSYEIKKIAEALSSTRLDESLYKDGDITMRASEDTPALQDRVIARIAHQEAKKQRNIEEISSRAAEELKDEDPAMISDESVDEGWISRFFRSAEEVSSEHMQVLWGKVLAGEVRKPKSYSFRTLDILKSLTHEEALLFEKLARIRIESGQEGSVINPDHHKYLADQFGITYDNVLLLREAGLLISNDFLSLSFSSSDEPQKIIFDHGPMVIWVEVPPGQKPKNLPVISFTTPGNELSCLVDVTPNEDYVNKLASLLKTGDIKVKSGIIKDLHGGQYTLRNTKEL